MVACQKRQQSRGLRHAAPARVKPRVTLGRPLGGFGEGPLGWRARQLGRQRLGEAAVALSKVQSVDQRMRLECRCRLSSTADVPSHTFGADGAGAWLMMAAMLIPRGKYLGERVGDPPEHEAECASSSGRSPAPLNTQSPWFTSAGPNGTPRRRRHTGPSAKEALGRRQSPSPFSAYPIIERPLRGSSPGLEPSA